MSSVTSVHLKYTCHVCKSATCIDNIRLRKHLLFKEGLKSNIVIPVIKAEKRAADKSIVVIKSSDLEKYAEKGIAVIVKYGCPSCSDLFDGIDTLKDHIDFEHLTSIQKKYDAIADSPTPPIMTPIVTNIDTDELVVTKKVRTTSEAIARAYQLHSADNAHSQTIQGVMNGISLKAFTMFPDTEDELYGFSPQTELAHIITTCDRKGIPVSTCSDYVNVNNTNNTKCSDVEINNNYLHFLISRGKLNVVPLMSDSYAEITKPQVELLNEDWNFGFHLRAVCTQLLAGALLVEKNEVVLINCIELYCRLRYLDAHSEKYGGTSNFSSLPINLECYSGINICNFDTHNSHKLVIGTYVFTALITSSMRLDCNDIDPELGPIPLKIPNYF